MDAPPAFVTCLRRSGAPILDLRTYFHISSSTEKSLKQRPTSRAHTPLYDTLTHAAPQRRRMSHAPPGPLRRAARGRARRDSGGAEIGEDGLIAYPSPLLGAGLLEKLPEVLAAEVLARLDPTDLMLFGQAGRACRAAVVAFGVPQEEEVATSDDDGGDEGSSGEGTERGPLLLRVQDFVGSVERLAWAKARGCPWKEDICTYAASGGHLEVLKWAWERRCPWNNYTCTEAAWGGHLEVLKWAREHRCPWDEDTCSWGGQGRAPGGGEVGRRAWVPVERKCSLAALGGHLHVLQFLRESGCPWDSRTCATGGHLEVLKWAREKQCPWHDMTLVWTVSRGHLEVLQWAREHGCPWTAATRDEAATKGYSDTLPLSV